MSTKSRYEAAKATFVNGHELEDTQIFDILEYVEELEAALKQEGHTVEFAADGFALEHPVGCRKTGLLNCPVQAALNELPDTPVGYGRFPVALGDDGVLVFRLQPNLNTIEINITREDIL
jgi:hypothetical protein